MSPAQVIVAGLGGLSIGGMYIWLGFLIYMTCTQLDVVLAHLKNSPDVVFLSRTRKNGFVGKFRLMADLSAIVTFPHFHSRRVKVNPDDLSSIPAPIKRTLAIMQWSAFVILSLLILSWVIGKLTGEYR